MIGRRPGGERRERLPRDVIVLGVIAFCVAVGFGVLVPVLPVFAREFGVSNVAVGAVVSAFAVMRLVASPWCAAIMRVLGERTVLAVGMAIVAASSALAGLAQTYAQLLVLRGVGGIGSAMFTVSAMTLLLGSTSPAIRGRAAAFYQGGFLLGGMAGPAVGGALAGISLTAPFFFYAATLVVAGAVGLVFLRARVTGPQVADEAAMPFHVAWRDVRYRAACLSNLAQGWNSFGVRNSLIPILITEVLLYQAHWTGIVFAIAAVAQTATIGIAGKLVDTRGRRPAMIGAGLGAGACLLLAPFMPNLWLLALVLVGYALASAFLGTAPAASVGDVAGAHSAKAVAAFSMCADIGSIVGPLAAGALADAFGFPVAFAAGAILMVAAGFYAFRMPGRFEADAAGAPHE